MLLITILLVLAFGVSIKIDNNYIKNAEEEFCKIECK
jgi:hypothetical protein